MKPTQFNKANAFLSILIVIFCCHCTFAELDPETEARITDLINQMTLEEKVWQMDSDGYMTTRTISRLNIPGLNMRDCPRGLRRLDYGPSTCFPVTSGQAATWDRELYRLIGRAIAAEARIMGANMGLGPCIDVCRDPRAGRTQETPGEDPYLASEYAVACINGMQGDDRKLIATPKHFIVNTMETGRSGAPHVIDERSLVEHYSYPFVKAYQEADAWATMSAYNMVNGTLCSDSWYISTDLVRNVFGYEYFIISDLGAIGDGIQAVLAGTDVEGGTNHYAQLVNWVNQGQIPLAVVEESARRVLRAKIKAGLLDSRPYVPDSLLNSPEHQQLALEVSQKSIVLLKNQDNILPLDINQVNTIAVIGPNAQEAVLGCTISSDVYPPYAVSVLDGLNNRITDGTQILYTKGCNINDGWTDDFNNAKSLASQADFVIFAGGLDFTVEQEGRDRTTGDILLPGQQPNLINQLASVNSNIIVVLIGSGAMGLEPCINNITGLLMAWYAGMEGGNAIADVILGSFNPGGKLDITFPKNVSQMPPWNNDHTDDIVHGRGYMWYDKQGIDPEFPFGFGLSYTSFSISNFDMPLDQMRPGEILQFTIDVTNTGSRTGDEVVQVYIQDVQGSVPMPVKRLRDFQRITLEPGQAQSLAFTIDEEDLAFYDVNTRSFIAEEGEFNVMVGNSSRNIIFTKGFLYSATTPADAPNNIVATTSAGPQVHLSWQDNSNGETGFTIIRKPYNNDNNWHTVGTVGANTTTFIDTNGVYGMVHYTYRIGATKD